MTQLHLIGVVVRVFALYVVITTLQAAPNMFASAKSWGADTSQIAIAALALSVPIIAALLLWFFNLSVARRLYFGGSHDKPVDLAGVEHLEAALFSALGLWLVCSGLVDGAFWIAFYNVAQAPEWINQTVVSPEQQAGVLSTGFQLILGIVVLLRGRGIAVLVRKLRS